MYLNDPRYRWCTLVGTWRPLGNMSQSPISVGDRSRTGQSDAAVVDAEETVQVVLEALTDADSRAILEAVGEAAEPLSAAELSEACDVPLSTTYRKLDRLTDAGLLAERTRISRSGNHATEYECGVEDVQVSVGPDAGLEVCVSRPDAVSRNARSGWGGDRP